MNLWDFPLLSEMLSLFGLLFNFLVVFFCHIMVNTSAFFVATQQRGAAIELRAPQQEEQFSFYALGNHLQPSFLPQNSSRSASLPGASWLLPCCSTLAVINTMGWRLWPSPSLTLTFFQVSPRDSPLNRWAKAPSSSPPSVWPPRLSSKKLYEVVRGFLLPF